MDFKQAKENFDRLKKVQGMIVEKKRQLELQRQRLSSLYRDLEKENRDVEVLEKTSFSTLFSKMMGSYENKLEQEIQEARIVELRFKEARRVEEDILLELNELEKEAHLLEFAPNEYRVALEAKRDALPADKRDEMEKYQEKINGCNSVIKEALEAVEAGNEAKVYLDKAMRSLSSAQNWGVADMFGLDLIADIAKHQKINEARELINRLQMALRKFKTELVDVRFDHNIYVNISSFDTMVDFFFDNMFFDFMVQSKITQAKSELDGAYVQIEGILAKLNQLVEEKEKEIRDIKESVSHIFNEE